MVEHCVIILYVEDADIKQTAVWWHLHTSGSDLEHSLLCNRLQMDYVDKTR